MSDIEADLVNLLKLRDFCLLKIFAFEDVAF